jgi:two-component system phosphate regulon sensor histidine kinase PhoR
MKIYKLISVHKYLTLTILLEIISILTLINLNISLPLLLLVLFSYIVITMLFVTNGISTGKSKADYFLEMANRLKPYEGEKALNNYEEKIAKVNAVIEEMSTTSDEYKNINGFSEVLEAFKIIIQRLQTELNAAKIFKVNRNEFLGNVAHELRTPIFAIQLSLETLADGAINDADVNMDFLEKAVRQSNRLKELVDDLINISRLETGMKLNKGHFSINSLVNETVIELSGIVNKKNIKLSFVNETDDEIMVFADYDRIKQVLINLIDNSSKYTPEEGSITIKTKEGNKCVQVTVEDTGLGIPKEDLPRIFERFYRVDKTRSRDMGGSGLGLSIVKHILELHNSQIKADSKINEGTRFEFNLPT